MNKYQEALEILCTYADGNPSSSGEFVGKMLQEANDTLQELVEKATQKAPSLYQDYDLEKEFWECPTCGSFLCENGEEYRHGGYCEDCGQRIDWSGEDE